jgi:methionyl-tRNA formyltransferase
MRIIIVNSAQYFTKQLKEKIKLLIGVDNVFFMQQKEELSYSRLKEVCPDFIFFMHWSYMIPANIYESFNCIIFHMTDLPFGRGGSPLQNLISRKIYHTKISAIQCVAEVDAGPVFLKKDLPLYGTAQEIYLRANSIMVAMMQEIIDQAPVPLAQSGEITVFKRRLPSASNIETIDDLEMLFDQIRMLDADGYPKAFLETRKFILEFERASFKGDLIIADVKIRLKNDYK